MITIEGVTRKYGAFTAVDDVSFTAEAGRVTGFLGPNGAGTSTTMRVMVGLPRATSGTVTISGRHYIDLSNPGLEVGVLLGATVRLLGDPAQLTAVDAGGALRLLEAEVGAVHLHQLHRFTNPDEADSTLALRHGDPSALAFYQRHHRIHSSSKDAMLEQAYDAWTHDILTGKRSMLIAGTTSDVTALNARARAERITTAHVQHDPRHPGRGRWNCGTGTAPPSATGSSPAATTAPLPPAAAHDAALTGSRTATPGLSPASTQTAPSSSNVKAIGIDEVDVVIAQELCSYPRTTSPRVSNSPTPPPPTGSRA
jgi:energy-coupling factor transporter ATP-binding protein EcfA2